jgi:hypothetical protein
MASLHQGKKFVFVCSCACVSVTALVQVTVEMDDGAEVAVKLSNLVPATGAQEIGREEGRQGSRVWLRGLVNAADLNGASVP